MSRNQRHLQHDKIAETNVVGGLGFSTPAINDGGTVAFISTDPAQAGLLVGHAGSLTSIFPSSVPFVANLPGGAAPSINDAGTVAAIASSPLQAVISGSGGTPTIISSIPPVGGTTFPVYSGPAIDGSGNVAFSYYHLGGAEGLGVFVR